MVVPTLLSRLGIVAAGMGLATAAGVAVHGLGTPGGDRARAASVPAQGAATSASSAVPASPSGDPVTPSPVSPVSPAASVSPVAPGADVAGSPAGSSSGPDVVLLRRTIGGLDLDGLDAADARVLRLPATQVGEVRYRVTLALRAATVTVDLLQADESVPTLCLETRPGCRVESWATAPNSVSYTIPDREDPDTGTGTSAVEVRLSYVVDGQAPWAARVKAEAPLQDGYPGADELRAIGTELATAVVPPEAYPRS